MNPRVYAPLSHFADNIKTGRGREEGKKPHPPLRRSGIPNGGILAAAPGLLVGSIRHRVANTGPLNVTGPNFRALVPLTVEVMVL